MATESRDFQSCCFSDREKEEALHGDWLVVRRKKRGGNEKKKGGPTDKGKNPGVQSLSNEGNNQEKIPMKEKERMGSPHLLTFPPTAASLANSNARGKEQDNGKKRARRDNQRKELVRKETVMHGNEFTHVQLSEKPQGDIGMSSSHPPSSKDDTVLKVRQIKEVKMNGFDLGTEIVISPNLLEGIRAQNSKGGKPTGWPQDSKAIAKPIPKESKGQHGNGEVLKDVGQHGTDSMMLDSGQ
ncbi:hypothetical protein RIF29_39375 [Crotalaria pallida]|uniref:Uncharacterized protein n=1 Tax=Crotalaria pallida TaxID=3830 RepID=A0AAN9E1Y5_CROPI